MLEQCLQMLENAWPLQVAAELQAAGLNPEAISGIMAAMQVRSLEDLQQLLGDDTPAVQQLQRLFWLAEGYGFQDWLVFDASIVRGLAYYTGQRWNLTYCSFQSVGT
jgi:histidyl-tRNA synthetase